MSRMFTSPYRTVMSIAGVAIFTSSLLLVASPVSAAAPDAEQLTEPTFSPTSTTATRVEFDQPEYVPSRLRQDETAEKEIAAVALSFSGSTYGAVVMGYVADSRGMESQRHGTALVVSDVSESDIEDLEDTASYFGGFEGVEVFYKDEVSIAGELDVPTSNDPLGNTDEYDAVDVGDLWADIENPDDEIVVAVLDTGVTEITELSGRVLPGFDFTDEGDGVWTDEHGHGTFVAAQIAGGFNNGTGSYGICQQCKILPVQVLLASGSGNMNWVAAGIRWAADNGADIISMSLGGPSSQLLADEVAYAQSKGAILVGAAGNSGKNWNQNDSNKFYPAATEGVISVAASNPDGSGSLERASFSNYGKLSGGVDIAAPGCVFAAGLSGDEWKCGTSMATPIVSAVIGLMLAQFPDLTGSEITHRLFGFASANPLDYTIQGHIEGTSLLDESVFAPAPLTPPEFGVTVSGAWECTAVEVGQLPVTLENTGNVDASVEIVFAGFYWDETTDYETVIVPAGQTASLVIDRSVFPGYIAEFYMYEVGGGADFLNWDYILDHNDCAGFTVEHLDLAPHLCHVVPGQEELGIQRSTEVEHITTGNAHRIWIRSHHQKTPSSSYGLNFGGVNSHGKLMTTKGIQWDKLAESGTITLSVTPWFMEPFYSDSTTAYEVDVEFDNPCDDSYLPVVSPIENNVDWSTWTLDSGEYASGGDVEVNLEDIPANTEVEVLRLHGYDIYEKSTYDWSFLYSPVSDSGSVTIRSEEYRNYYEDTEDVSILASYRYRYRLNDGIAKSEWTESPVQFSVFQDLSIGQPQFYSYCESWDQVHVNWYSPPSALWGTLLDYQITIGSEPVSPDVWEPVDETLFNSDAQGMNSRDVDTCAPDPDVVGDDVFLHIRRTETAVTADGDPMGGEPKTFTIQVPTGIGGGEDSPEDPVDENPGDDPGEDDPVVDDPIVDDPIDENPGDDPVVDDPVADDPVDERPADDAAELVEGSRLTDTRNADGYGLPGGMIRYVQVAGVGDVPADATAATVNFTVAGAAGWGYLTAWSCDSADSTVPDSSILNYDAGWVRANTQTIGLGASGGICVWSYNDIDLLVDTQGFFNSPSVHMYTEPSRVADDRGTNGLGDYNAGEVRRIEVGNDAVAAFVNLTVVDAKEWGFLTAWPCESEYDSPPNASAANYDAGQTVANNALVSLNNGGFCVYSYGQTGVIVDLMGTIDENETSVVPLGSQRLVDTRTGASTIDGMHAGGGRIEAGQTRAFQITGRGNVPFSTLNKNGNPAGLSGVYLNVTSVNPQGTGGFLTIWACEHANEKVPNTSALNYNDRWSATPNSIVQKVNDGGQICIYAFKTTDVIVDVTGYVT